MERKDEAGDEAARPGAPVRRRPYSRPQLTVYGPLAKLTRSATSGTGEVSPQGAMMMCL
jgi:hypothetical protein